jgi:hypothetical protein
VKAHTNDHYNEVADHLAKNGIAHHSAIILINNVITSPNSCKLLWDGRIIDRPIRKFLKEVNQVTLYKKLSTSRAYLNVANKDARID